ncbi:MAG: HEAT repeat domain-containing protein [Acidobacteriota bacterium]
MLSLGSALPPYAALVARPALAKELPARRELVERVVSWKSLPPEDAADLLQNLRDAEARDAIARGDDDVLPFLALAYEDRPAEADAVLVPLLASRSAGAARRAVLLATTLRAPDATAAALERLGIDPLLDDAIAKMCVELRPKDAEEALRRRLDDAPRSSGTLLAALADLATSDSLSFFMDQAESDDANVRRLSARGLRHAGDHETVAYVTKLLAVEKDGPARRELTLCLGALGGTKELADLTTCLGSPRPRLDRALCLEALTLSPDPTVVRALAGILEEKRNDLRREAVTALGGRTEDSARTALLSVFEEEDDPIVFRFEADALARLQEKRAARKLVKALDDPNLAIWAALALGQLGDAAAIPVLRELAKDPELREDAIKLLLDLHDRNAVPIVEEIYDREKRARVRALALKAIMVLGARS